MSDNNRTEITVTQMFLGELLAAMSYWNDEYE
jgi:hypothetical protein